MTRLKTLFVTALGLVIALAAVGIFASVGLAVLGALASIGLVAALATWLAAAFGREEGSTEA